MIPVRRLEIVVDAPHAERVLEVLSRHGITAWTLVRGVTGAGERGLQHGDGITEVSSNHLIVTTCPPEVLEALAEDLRSLLALVGGMCLVSDALWLRH